VLVPVPSQPAAARARGGDHVRRLAAVAATHLSAAGRSVRVVPALRCTAAVRDSAGLSAAERAENLAGAYTLHPPAAHRLRADDAPVVVLVDDLVTTGATLQVAAQTLRGLRLGAQITAAVIGATQRRRPSCAIRGLGQGRVNG
jgi:predicted amidophosphoribosyltransferase